MVLPFLLTLIAVDLTPESAPRLSVAWTFHTNATAPNKRTGQIAAFEATPVLSNGLLYVITPFNQVIALDPGTGVEHWRYDPKIASDRNYSEASARGITVSLGKVFFGTLDARLIALDARTGRQVWQTKLDAASTDGNFRLLRPQWWRATR